MSKKRRKFMFLKYPSLDAGGCFSAHYATLEEIKCCGCFENTRGLNCHLRMRPKTEAWTHGSSGLLDDRAVDAAMNKTIQELYKRKLRKATMEKPHIQPGVIRLFLTGWPMRDDGELFKSIHESKSVQMENGSLMRNILKIIVSLAWAVVLPLLYMRSGSPISLPADLNKWFGQFSKGIENSDWHIIRFSWWSQPRIYVGRGMHESTLCSVVAVEPKLAFSYFFQVYFMDTQIGMQFFSTLTGGVSTGALGRLGGAVPIALVICWYWFKSAILSFSRDYSSTKNRLSALSAIDGESNSCECPTILEVREE
ncbi:hypothetical protein HPP92_010386 [Vanilla planifolia]|uniref:Uncharacterized protein n=1 Tax=Vanilla planifolia TaxID=51239 RepID=A0A835UZP6_VANPL|nr:hypothetical protein HPP92_010386 [Vanilla planifolia]